MNNRIAIVTGGAGDIGFGIAKALANDGCRIALIDVNDEKGAKAEKELNTLTEAKYYSCELRSTEEIGLTVKKINADFGTPLILVNAAGIPVRYPIEEITSEKWENFMSINLKAAFFMSQAFAKTIREEKTGFGRIINISSVRDAAIDTTHLGYSITKAGIDIVTKGFAVTYGPDGITANAIAPGYVMTEMTAHYAETLDKATQEKLIAAFTPSHRPVEVSEIGDLVVFLASEKSCSISGQVIKIDGGGNNIPGSYY